MKETPLNARIPVGTAPPSVLPLETPPRPGGASTFRRVRIESAYKAVSADIERSILEGAIQPGMPLPTEQELADRFGVPRSTVRKAIRQVKQEGLLQRREGRRLFVPLPGLYDLAPRTARLAALDVAFHALVGRASSNRARMLAREPVSLLYNPALLQLYERLPQSRVRNLQAHRQILGALQQRDDPSAETWTRKHMDDFRRGFALAGLDMAAPLMQPH